MIDALDVIPDREWSACISPACAHIGSRLVELELLAFLIRPGKGKNMGTQVKKW